MRFLLGISNDSISQCLEINKKDSFKITKNHFINHSYCFNKYIFLGNFETFEKLHFSEVDFGAKIVTIDHCGQIPRMIW